MKHNSLGILALAIAGVLFLGVPKHADASTKVNTPAYATKFAKELIARYFEKGQIEAALSIKVSKSTIVHSFTVKGTSGQLIGTITINDSTTYKSMFAYVYAAAGNSQHLIAKVGKKY